MTVAGLVLAAGGGSRYGGPKALVEFEGELLVERAVRLLAEGGCDPVYAVLGAAADRVRAATALAHVVENPDWASGIGSSFRAGLSGLPASADAAVIGLADEPLIGVVAVRRLIRAYQDGAAAAVATYGGQPRNPVLLTREVFAAAAETAVGDRGARAWLRANPDLVVRVACDDTGEAVDVDTPDDLAAALAAAAALRAGRGDAT